MSEMDKEIKRLRHHVSVLSKRNHQLMQDGKSSAASLIASDASLNSSDDVELESEIGEEDLLPRQQVKKTLIGEEVRKKAHSNGVPAPWCEKGAEEFHAQCQERDRYLGRTKWKVAELKVAEKVEAESMAEEEEEMAEPKVRLPSFENKGKRRRVGVVTKEEEEVREVRELITPLGPRAVCGGLLRRVEKELVFADADLRLVVRGCPTPAAVGVSQQSGAWRKSAGVSGGYQLRPRFGGYRIRGYGEYGRGRGVL